MAKQRARSTRDRIREAVLGDGLDRVDDPFIGWYAAPNQTA